MAAKKKSYKSQEPFNGAEVRACPKKGAKMISQNYLDLSVKVILRDALRWEAPCAA